MPDKTTARHFIFETPFGKGAFVFLEAPFGLREVILPRAGVKELKAALKRSHWGKPGCHPRVEILLEWINGYFSGKVDSKPWPPWEWLDLTGLTALQRAVLHATAAIPYGKVASYRRIAETVGRPGAARFVGTTMSKNPFPILIPCHRVIRSDGSIGQFGGGPELKKKLLEREARLAVI